MPLRSMTGFGIFEATTESGSYQVELRGVNNRFLEIQTRLPKLLSNLEQDIKKEIGAAISRGSISVFVTCNREDKENALSWDKPAVDAYMRIFSEIQRAYGLADSVTLSDLLGFSDIIKMQATQADDKVQWEHLKPVLTGALVRFQESRETEGTFIARDLRKTLKSIAQTVAKVEKRAPARMRQYGIDLRKKIETLTSSDSVDPQRVAMEVALMADKLDISEECTRLRAHLDRFDEDLKSEEPVGKRLNFLLQEMNREANTIGSKANDTEIAHLSVLLKEYVERIREQIQNIE